MFIHSFSMSYGFSKKAGYQTLSVPDRAPAGGLLNVCLNLSRVLESPWVIFLVALTVRLLVMVYMQSFQIQDTWKFGFETGRIASSIASGHGFSSPLQGPSGPTAWLPPVYPYMLAGIFKFFGIYSSGSALVALTLNSVFSALTCVTIFHIGRKTFGPKVASWAGWSWAFFPYAVFWSTNWVWATSLSALLFSLICLSALQLERYNSSRPWFGFGVLWGVIGLTDTALLSILPFFVGWLYYRLSRQGVALPRAISACAVGFLLILTPWLVRNYLTFGEFVFVKGNFGMELHLGNHEGSSGLSGGRLLHPAGNDGEFERFRQMGELSYVKESKRQALDFIATHPGTFIWLTLRRVVYFWTGNSQLLQIFPLSGRFEAARYILFTLVSVLAFWGLFSAFRNGHPAVPLFAIILIVFPLVYYVTHPTPRYRHPIEPAMVLLATYVMKKILSKPFTRRGEV
ncbi:MAG TPA: glycosyltransferase family 39 protein [Candidatus Binatia bacterium]|nr:glycosyltransferase family 39 protein [Candidatus Binatia bacterium]